MMANIVGSREEELEIGLSVHVVLDELRGDIVLPQFMLGEHPQKVR